MTQDASPRDSSVDHDFEDKEVSGQSILVRNDLDCSLKRRNDCSRGLLPLAAICHLTLLLLLGLALVVISQQLGHEHPYGVNLIKSTHRAMKTSINRVDTRITGPARDAVEYERVLLDNNLDEVNPFKGNPRPELDEAWGSILQCMSIESISGDTILDF